MQLVGVVQVTSASPLTAATGLGVVMSDQRLLLQRSASVLVADSVLYCPTAMQFAPLVHCTADRWLDCAPAGFGLICATHFFPFQRSISFTLLPPETFCVPTATQTPGAGHDTPASVPNAAPAAVGTTVQRGAVAPAGADHAAAAAMTTSAARPARAARIVTWRAPHG